MNRFLCLLSVLMIGLSGSGQEKGNLVDFANPRAGDYILLDYYLSGWCHPSIRPDQTLGLDLLLQEMQNLPDWTFCLEVHTDCRGSQVYNDLYSSAKADTFRNYLISKGFPEWRLAARGMGERMLLVDTCSCDMTDTEHKCPEQAHSLNRRTLLRLVERINWTGYEPISLQFPSPGQYRLIPIDTEKPDLVAANRQLELFLDSLQGTHLVYCRVYYLHGKWSLKKGGYEKLQYSYVRSLSTQSLNPSLLSFTQLRTGKSMYGIDQGYVVLIDSVISPECLLAEFGLSGRARVLVRELPYRIENIPPHESSAFSSPFLVPLEDSSTRCPKFRLIVATGSTPNSVYCYFGGKRRKVIQDSDLELGLGKFHAYFNSIPVSVEITEIVYVSRPDLIRPSLYLLQAVD